MRVREEVSSSFSFFLIKKEENLSRNPRLTIPQILIGQDWVTPRS